MSKNKACLVAGVNDWLVVVLARLSPGLSAVGSAVGVSGVLLHCLAPVGLGRPFGGQHLQVGLGQSVVLVACAIVDGIGLVSCGKILGGLPPGLFRGCEGVPSYQRVGLPFGYALLLVFFPAPFLS